MNKHLLIDPTKCDGVGICAIKAPDLIQMDVWGFPIIESAPLTDDTKKQAKKALRACPKKALLIIERENPA